MKKLAILILVFSLNFFVVNAQNVGIGTDSPHVSAKLEVSSNNSGFLPPRMTTSQRNTIVNPVAGLQIYNTTTDCLEIFSKGRWQKMFCGVEDTTAIAAVQCAKLYDFSLTFDTASATATTLGGNYKRYQGITGVDTALDVVLVYNVVVSATGTKLYYAMPSVSLGVAFNFVYYRNIASTNGGLNLYIIIEDPADGSINPIFTITGYPTHVEQFRAVVIKATSRNSNVNYNDYNSVASFYHLPME